MPQMEFLERLVGKYRARWAFRKLAPHLRKRERVLNLGAGDGLLSVMIEERFGAAVVDADVRDTLLARGRSVTLYDGENLPFPDSSFDCVLLLYVLHHCSKPEQVAREAARVCRGRVLVLEDTNLNEQDLLWLTMLHWYLEKVEGMPLAECKFLKPAEWAALFERCGLTAVLVKRWPRYLDILPPGSLLYDLRRAASQGRR